MTESSKVNELIRERLQNVLIAQTTAGFAKELVSGIELGDVQVEGVELTSDHGHEDTAPGRYAKATVTHYFTVTEDCCNLGGSAHGGFLAWLVDVCSSEPLLALSGHGRWNTSGVSSNISMYYISGAPPGTRLKLVSELLMQGLTLGNVECRVTDDATGRLVAVGIHVKSDTAKKGAKRKEGKYML